MPHDDQTAREQFQVLLHKQQVVRAEIRALHGLSLDWGERADKARKSMRNARTRAEMRGAKVPQTAVVVEDTRFADSPDQARIFAGLPLALVDEGVALTAEYHKAKERESAISQELKTLEGDVKPRPGTACLVLGTGGYGYNQSDERTYKRVAAEMHADVARLHGIEVDVVELCDWTQNTKSIYTACSGGWAEGNFAAVVYVQDAVDVEILKRLPGPGLVEQVRLCWKRGANPRVYMPRLPHGFEQTHGLDFFGGYTRPPATQAKVP